MSLDEEEEKKLFMQFMQPLFTSLLAAPSLIIVSHTPTDALPLYPQRRKESDVSDDSLSSDHWMLTQTDVAEKEEYQQDSPEQPENKSINGDCSSVSPKPVKVQEGTVVSPVHF